MSSLNKALKFVIVLLASVLVSIVVNSPGSANEEYEDAKRWMESQGFPMFEGKCEEGNKCWIQCVDQGKLMHLQQGHTQENVKEVIDVLMYGFLPRTRNSTELPPTKMVVIKYTTDPTTIVQIVGGPTLACKFLHFDFTLP